MEKTEAPRMGREWLEHSPPFDRRAIYHGCAGMTGAAGFVCHECCMRITGRGCNLKAIASVPIWEPGNYVCALCEPEFGPDTEEGSMQYTREMALDAQMPEIEGTEL